MSFEIIKPMEIEKESFRIIKQELDLMGKSFSEEMLPVVERVIHTTADFEYADTLTFSIDCIQKAKKAIMEGAHIVTDTNMTLSGINKKMLQKFGGDIHCFMAEWHRKLCHFNH